MGHHYIPRQYLITMWKRVPATKNKMIEWLPSMIDKERQEIVKRFPQEQQKEISSLLSKMANHWQIFPKKFLFWY